MKPQAILMFENKHIKTVDLKNNQTIVRLGVFTYPHPEAKISPETEEPIIIHMVYMIFEIDKVVPHSDNGEVVQFEFQFAGIEIPKTVGVEK